MIRNAQVYMVIALLIAGVSMSWGQRDERGSRGSRGGRDSGSSSRGTLGNYRDISQRDTLRSERNDRKKKAEEAAKKKAAEEKQRDERRKRWEEARRRREGDDKDRDSKKSPTKPEAAKPARTRGAGGPAKQPNTKGGSTDPTLREVTEVMLDAVKTQNVKFDPKKAANDPGMIILNKPKFDSSDRVRAGDFGIDQPL